MNSEGIRTGDPGKCLKVPFGPAGESLAGLVPQPCVKAAVVSWSPSRRTAAALLLCCGLYLAPAEVWAADQAFGTLRGRILDADTGLPTPCTVTLIDATGRTVLERESFKAGFRSDGHFTKRLPAGRTRIRVARGFETRAEEQELTLPAGGEAEATVRLRRLVHLRQRGWYAGDSHVHMIHGERTIPVDFDQVALAAQAEDLQYLSLAQAWTIDKPTPESLAAELQRRSRPNCLVTWNLEAPKNYYRGDAGRCLGHGWCLGVRGRTPAGLDTISLLLQASAHDYESDKPSFANFESHQLIHAQGGAAFYSHPARWWTGPWGGQGGYARQERMRISNLAVELPLDTLIGPTFDGLDILTSAGEFQANAAAFEIWCLLLNRGYRVAATASSDSCFDRPGGATPGVVRTYTYLKDGFSLPAVTRATARGKTFVTSGPLLLVSVDGQPPGTSVSANHKPRTMSIEAWASGTDPQGLTRLEILRNGQQHQATSFSPPAAAIQTNVVLHESENAWYCVRVFGGNSQRQRAISGAFFFDAKPFQPPAPVPARVHVSLVDAATGEKLSGTVSEVLFHATLAQEGRRQAVAGEGIVTVPGTARLRAELPGYRPVTLSPFLDNPELLDTVTRLTAEDLVKWETFERVRSLLNEVRLVFKMQKATP